MPYRERQLRAIMEACHYIVSNSTGIIVLATIPTTNEDKLSREIRRSDSEFNSLFSTRKFPISIVITMVITTTRR